ncbi:MAG: polysaccharide biosynthesis protein [Pseudomonadales bacterium]|nr:polysaccharide biosynthesis protein [Pseudomonadales bacterium]|tara:strand:+ start:1458 stop:2756 length:1299 start_codon:yes stop_codon:yes gene_type:complete
MVWIREVLRSRFIRNVAVVATGTAGAQVITMLFSPMVTRIYGPEAFGLLGTFIAILAVLTPMAAMSYPIAIVLPKRDVEALMVAKLSLVISAMVFLLVFFVIIVWGDLLVVLLGADVVKDYLWLVPIAMLFSALHQICEQYVIRQRKFRAAARVALIQSIALNTAKTGAGMIYPAAMVLVLMQAINSGVHAFLLWFSVRRNFPVRNWCGPETGINLRSLSYKYRDFAFYRAPEGVINAASQSLPILMLAALFGPASAGFYTLGRTVMGMPAALIGKSVGDVFYPRISEAANKGEELYPLVRNATLALAAVGVLPFLIVIIFGPSLFSFVFGDDWAEAGDYARWLAIWMFFMFINNPSIKVIPVIRVQGFQLAYTLLSLVLRACVLYFAYYCYRDDQLAVSLFSVLGAILNIGLIAIVFVKCAYYDRAGVVDG